MTKAWMKKERYALRYNAPFVWLTTLPLLAVLAGFAWESGMPLIYARNAVDLMQHRVPAGYDAAALSVDVLANGYAKHLLSQHTHRIKTSGCSPCHCSGHCSCCARFDTKVEPFTGLEFLVAGLMMAGLFGSIVQLINTRLARVVLTPKNISLPLSFFSSAWGQVKSISIVSAGREGELSVLAYSLLHQHALARKPGEVSAFRRGLTSAPVEGQSPLLADGLDLGDDDVRKATKIAFCFMRRPVATLTLGKFRDSDVPLFLSALEKWAERVYLAPEVQVLMDWYRTPREEKVEKPLDQSYTAMWQEELGAHMAATTFVPLTKGVTLQSGRLKVIALLASGGLSAVYLGETFDGKMVILKESVVPQHVDDKTKEKARELFEREARLLLKLQHPRIARVVDHVHEAGRDYLVLEYIPGQSLRQVVKRSGRQDEATVLRWAGEIADILGYLHSMTPPIIHRDLTPDNLVLKEDGTIALIDFGAANEYVGAATGTLIGKQSYMSPEQFRGKATPASDIYALGATLYFLLTGDDPEALSTSHPQGKRAELSAAIDAFIASCTEEEEDARVASIAELKAKLAALKLKT